MLVLETDGMHPEHQNEKGSFGQVFDHVFNKAGKTHKPELGVETIIKFIVEAEGGEIPKLEEMDDMHAILITGSKYDAHGDDEWIVKLIKLVQGQYSYTLRSCHYVWKWSRQVLTWS